MSLQNKWDVDTQTGLAMNEVAKELGINSADVKHVISSYYRSVATLMEDKRFPRIQIFGFAMVKPIFTFLNRRAKRLSRVNKNGQHDETIANYIEVANRIRECKIKTNPTKKLKILRSNE